MKSFWQWVWFVLILAAGWSVTAMYVNNPFLCPAPSVVIEQMLLQLQSANFWPSVFQTILRSLAALAASLLLALPVAFLAAFYEWSAGFLNRLVSLLQTIPNVCFIILLLFWTSRTQTVILTGFFLLFPLCYRSFYEQLKDIQHQWHAVWTLYPQPKPVLMWTICLPMMRPAITSALKSSSSLAFKSCVMAEILTGVMPGIGRSLQLSRLDLNLAGVFAWSLWLVLLVFAFESLWSWVLKKHFTMKE